VPERDRHKPEKKGGEKKVPRKRRARRTMGGDLLGFPIYTVGDVNTRNHILRENGEGGVGQRESEKNGGKGGLPK